MLPPKTTVPRTVPAIGSAPRQALALLVGDLQVAVDVDDLLGTQPLGEAVGAAERLTSGSGSDGACGWAMTGSVSRR